MHFIFVTDAILLKQESQYVADNTKLDSLVVNDFADI